MLAEPKCFTRHCVYYQGISSRTGNEMGEFPYCDAFPMGIPREIAYGNNSHSAPLPKQKNQIVYKRKR